jgi:hypothetical protein
MQNDRALPADLLGVGVTGLPKRASYVDIVEFVLVDRLPGHLVVNIGGTATQVS